MTSDAFRAHRPKWAPPPAGLYLGVGAILAGGGTLAFLLGQLGLDPAVVYAKHPDAVALTNGIGFVPVLLGAAGGALAGGVVWAIVTLAGWLSSRKQQDT
ncbi:MAG: hypothetical protein K0Q72_1209 [Armatimonadetes bacterium]|jgi:hypothetical protein|nr:hypothetical protein [Armatimonadota bacterium]